MQIKLTTLNFLWAIRKFFIIFLISLFSKFEGRPKTNQKIEWKVTGL